MEDQERIARFISDFSDWDGARQYIKEGWLHKADSLLQILKELGYRKPGELLSSPVEEAELAAIERVREREKEYPQKNV